MNDIIKLHLVDFIKLKLWELKLFNYAVYENIWQIEVITDRPIYLPSHINNIPVTGYSFVNKQTEVINFLYAHHETILYSINDIYKYYK